MQKEEEFHMHRRSTDFTNLSPRAKKWLNKLRIGLEVASMVLSAVVLIAEAAYKAMTGKGIVYDTNN